MNLITAHKKSLKILIIQVFTLPLTIYRDTIYKFSNNIEEKESEFKVLQWITKCFDALIVLSYTLGTVIFLLILTTVIEGGDPIWTSGERGASAEYYHDYKEYIEYSDEAYYSEKEFYKEKDRIESQIYRKRFQEEMFFALLGILYFLPLGLSLAKDLWYIFWNIINRNYSSKLRNIERNTDT